MPMMAMTTKARTGRPAGPAKAFLVGLSMPLCGRLGEPALPQRVRKRRAWPGQAGPDLRAGRKSGQLETRRLAGADRHCQLQVEPLIS
jgi:hypothetical protein